VKTNPADVIRSLAFYIVFYVGSILFVLTAVLSAPISQRVLHAAARGWSQYHRLCARIFLGIRVRVEGTPPAEGVLVAGKHESFFEAIDIPALMDRPVPFPKAELLRIPGWGRAARKLGAVGVERDQGATALRRMVTESRKFAAQGRPLVIFPEGTRVPHGQQPPLQSGFAGLYKLLGLPVVPIAVDSGALYHRRWKKPGTITVRIGERIEPGLPRAEVEARVHAAINALNPVAGPPTRAG
jgi:1-acyl-sn-glycerol-3-phosphate acyltransferase